MIHCVGKGWPLYGGEGGAGGGPLSWEGWAMVVVCGEVSKWAREFLTKMSSIRLEWEIE